ncbi:MnmC family methyltransferase [Bdellovibrio sp. NC01]|uniref:MnmC family methyltransferase n=1 Tax=Bdellovibrio sp. NC01 TaxID=2220073 RepID=UPI001159D1AD|nr:MnmC family methyltransferase [Bdellovibrio sp. NC01]QDK37796.1 hypothetical protein DOE51_09460 [Bdellovibrio sp. NC01]
MKSWKDIGFEIIITNDGSPTLRLLEPTDATVPHGEWMHHSGGACTETNLLYGNPAREVLKKIINPHFLIVGLGMGYIEMVIAREALLLGKKSSDVGLITSYESVPELREFFFAWLYDRPEISPEIRSTYDLALEHVLKEQDFSPDILKGFLRDHFKTVTDIHAALAPDVTLPSRYHGIMYDAFSSKTTPYLWEEEFLKQLLRDGSAEQSMFTTYACRGSLKRALKDQGFAYIRRDGFNCKRNSTLGGKNFSV